jgi:hypothetical protein
MTEADLSPLLSKPSPTQEEKKKKKDKVEDKEDSKKNKKRSRKELEAEEDEIEEQVIKQTKSNGVSESPAAKKEKAKIAESHVRPSPLIFLTGTILTGRTERRRNERSPRQRKWLSGRLQSRR